MEFLLVASAHFLALLSPGPDFFLIGQTALNHHFRSALALVCGIALANAIYLAIAISGTELFRQSENIFTVLQYLGGGYLVYLGIMLLKAPKRLTLIESEQTGNRLQHSFFIQGFLSGVLNPKNMIFRITSYNVCYTKLLRYSQF